MLGSLPVTLTRTTTRLSLLAAALALAAVAAVATVALAAGPAGSPAAPAAPRAPDETEPARVGAGASIGADLVRREQRAP